MEVSLDHFSGHCLWSGRDQSFQNVTSKNDPVWNAANPFRFLSTVSTQGIRFFKSKVQNSVAEGFIAPAPGSPPPSQRPTVSPNALRGCRRQGRPWATGCPCRDGLSTQGTPSTRAVVCSAGGRPGAQRSRGRAAAYLGPGEARSSRSPPAGLPAASPAPPRRGRGDLRGSPGEPRRLAAAGAAAAPELSSKALVGALRLASPCVSKLLRASSGGEGAGGEGSRLKNRDIRVGCR